MEKEEKEREEGCCRNRTKTWQKGRTVAEIHVTGRVSLRLKIDQAPGAVGGGRGDPFFSRKLFCGRGTPRGTRLTSSYEQTLPTLPAVPSTQLWRSV